MPAVSSPSTPRSGNSNVTSALLSNAHGHLTPRTYLVALAAVAALCLARYFFTKRLAPGWSWPKSKGRRHYHKDYRRSVLAAPSAFAAGGTVLGPQLQLSQQCSNKHDRLAFGWMTPEMDEKSRGVSGTSNSGAHDPPQMAGFPLAVEEPAGGNLSSSGGADGGEAVEMTMAAADRVAARAASLDHEGSSRRLPVLGKSTTFNLSTPRQLLENPPPPPPLTPPTLSANTFSFQDRRTSFAGSIHATLDGLSPTPFHQQPNPDYTSSSASGTDFNSSPSTPTRRIYATTRPIGIPQTATAPSGQGTHAASPTTKDPFAPASFPSAQPIFPPPPPGHQDNVGEGDETEGAAEDDDPGRQHANIDVQGEIIGVLDDDGAGWTRHTRVYGGGVCLACLASGGGGFYGANVPPEHRR